MLFLAQTREDQLFVCFPDADKDDERTEVRYRTAFVWPREEARNTGGAENLIGRELPMRPPTGTNVTAAGRHFPFLPPPPPPAELFSITPLV